MTIGSRLVFGTADLRDDSATGSLLDRFYEAGGRSLDVANVYADGESARAVGAWLASRDVRDEIVLYAKGCHPPYCSPSLVRAEVDKALTDLGVDRLDVFSLHRDDPDVPVEAFAEALVEQVESGKLAGFGVSNFQQSLLTRGDGDAHLAWLPCDDEGGHIRAGRARHPGSRLGESRLRLFCGS